MHQTITEAGVYKKDVHLSDVATTILMMIAVRRKEGCINRLESGLVATMVNAALITDESRLTNWPATDDNESHFLEVFKHLPGRPWHVLKK